MADGVAALSPLLLFLLCCGWAAGNATLNVAQVRGHVQHMLQNVAGFARIIGRALA